MGRKSSSTTLTLRGLVAVAVLRLLAWLPLRANRAVGTLTGLLSWWLHSNNRRITEINLGIAFPHLCAIEREQLARTSLIESARSMAELGWVWHRPEQALAITRGDNEAFQSALADGKPVMILAPHLGCWEVLNFWLTQQADLHAMFAPSKIARLDALVLRSRERLGSTLHPATARGVVSLVKAIRKGHAITAILPDQVPDKNSGLYADFYGRPARTGTLSSKLIQQTGATTFLAFAKRLPGAQGYQIIMQPAEADIYSDNLATSLAGLNRGVEQLIAQCPEQYLWSYKRFRKPPPGINSPYK